MIKHASNLQSQLVKLFNNIGGGGGWGTELWIKNTQLNLIKQVLNLGAGDQWSDVLSPDLHCTKLHKEVC